ncbi:GNAT family N-acetyltransferase [Bengtsoniella intestinalis]|uniref:GNAT family N-acetyltransferase n=1 Tax=Bengtsoniella intestinalis TaxID=3073143 RepID=UPI00391F1456
MNIRTATLADLEAVAAIEAACFPPAEAASKESFAQRLEIFPDHFWLVEQDGVLVGFLNGAVIDSDVIPDACYHDANRHNPNGAYQTVFGINTLPQYRKQGIGGAMLHAMIDAAKKEGRKGCILTCKDTLKGYYESFGYVSKGRSASTHGGAEWNDMILEF